MADDEDPRERETSDEWRELERKAAAQRRPMLDISYEGQLRTLHLHAQKALVGRVARLAESASVEDLQRLADVYLTLPKPDEDFPES